MGLEKSGYAAILPIHADGETIAAAAQRARIEIAEKALEIIRPAAS